MAKIGSEQRFKFVVRALVNSEGGSLRFASGYQPDCTECENIEERLGPFFYCNTCGRNPRRGGKVTSGDGDGIYPVIEVIDSSATAGAPVAVLVIFDSNYTLANRISGEAQQSTRPSISLADFANFLELPAAIVTDLESTNTIVLGGGSRFEPAVDCSIAAKDDLVARVYVEGPGRHTGNFAQANAEMAPTAHVPRLLAIGARENLDVILGRPSSELSLDWADEDAAAMVTIVTSHVKVVADDLCFANASIADSYLRDMSRHEHAIRNWDDDFFSWVLLGSELGNEWCIDMLSSTFGVPDKPKQASLLARRIFGDSPEATSESTHAPNSAAESVSNFCSRCGSRFKELDANFCPHCGHKRHRGD